MLDGLMMADHTLAMGSIALEPKSCENCRRPFQRKTTSVQAFCNPCRKMYQEPSAQLWGCVECGTERKFGDRRPDDTKGKFLHCSHCAAVTEHAYSRLSPGMTH
jgi:hypothetical protein